MLRTLGLMLAVLLLSGCNFTRRTWVKVFGPTHYHVVFEVDRAGGQDAEINEGVQLPIDVLPVYEGTDGKLFEGYEARRWFRPGPDSLKRQDHLGKLYALRYSGEPSWTLVSQPEHDPGESPFDATAARIDIPRLNGDLWVESVVVFADYDRTVNPKENRIILPESAFAQAVDGTIVIKVGPTQLVAN